MLLSICAVNYVLCFLSLLPYRTLSLGHLGLPVCNSYLYQPHLGPDEIGAYLMKPKVTEDYCEL